MTFLKYLGFGAHGNVGLAGHDELEDISIKFMAEITGAHRLPREEVRMTV